MDASAQSPLAIPAAAVDPEAARSALLPAGLGDLLPPQAAQEAAIIGRLMACLLGHGYEPVKPPLIEFERSLLALGGAKMGSRVFRMMDPVSQGMMGVRADITIQIARIAASRLRAAPRPLRLAYAGDVLRVMGSTLSPERQFVQVGAELIGIDTATADAEAIVAAAAALSAIGVAPLSVDLMMPPLVPAVIAAAARPPEDPTRLRAALDRKDEASVRDHGGGAVEGLVALLRATGPVEAGLARLSASDLPPAARLSVARLAEVASLVRAAAPDLDMTVDPVENRGFEYHSGISFSVFARGVRGELGRGGRYLAGFPPATPGAPDTREPAVGVTLYMDTVLRALPPPEGPARLYLPHGTPPEVAARLRAQGHVALAGLAPEPDGDVLAEAARLGCLTCWRDGAIATV